MPRHLATFLFAIGLALCTTRTALASSIEAAPRLSTVSVKVLDDSGAEIDASIEPPIWPKMDSEPGLHLPPPAAQSPAQRHLGDIPFRVDRDLTVRPESLWVRLRNGFGLADLNTPLVRDWENWYSTRPDYVRRVIERSQRYLFFIVEEVEKRNMPSEIALLPFIESAYNPAAYSRAHASGIWQFIPSTGKVYGLQQNWWQDERRDVMAATRAALDYLEKLYEMFGAWDLALAAYNWGEGAVSRAMARNEARGLRTDYVSLDMPAETRNYIPKLQAVKNIVANPRAFNVTLAEIPNEPYFGTVTTARHIDVKVAARLANLPLDEFVALNPAHNRPVIRADGATQILLPANRISTFHANLEKTDTPLASWQTYTVGRGERLEQVSARFGIPLAELRDVNSIPARLKSAAGLTILVPSRDRDPNLQAAVAPAPVTAASEPAPAPPARSRSHVVRPGETLSALAQRYGVTPQQLAAWNGLKANRIVAGQKLELSAPMQAVAARPAAKAAAAPQAKKSAATPPPSRAAAAKAPAKPPARVTASSATARRPPN
jgi:membrane-bound lytic murein transglycosylase D